MGEQFTVKVFRGGGGFFLNCFGDQETAKQILRGSFPGCAVVTEEDQPPDEPETFEGMTFDD